MVFALGLLCLSAGPAQSADAGLQQGLPEEFAGIPQSWVDKRLPDVGQDVFFLGYAYQIPEEARSALRHLVHARMAEQYSFERMMVAIDLSQKTDAERLKWLDDLARKSPLNPDRLEALAESLLPPGDFFAARRVFEELLARRVKWRRAELDDYLHSRQLSVWMKRQRVAGVPVMPSGHPVPMWVHERSQREYAEWASQEKKDQASREQITVRKATRDPGGRAVRRIQRGRAELGPAQADKVIVGLAFDTTRTAWRGCLEKIEDDQGLDGTRLAGIERTFSQMWKRAQTFRATQRAAYLDLQKLSSRKAFAQRLASLDAPLRPLFEEFKLRIDAQARAAR